MKIKGKIIINNLLYAFLIVFCLVCLFGFNNEHFDSSAVYTSIVVPYFNINLSMFFCFISILMFALIIVFKKIRISQMILLLFIRILLYIIPLMYINGEFKIGVFYAVVQCFLSFFIGVNSEPKNFENIVRILLIYTVIICLEEFYTLIIHKVSIFSSDIKWFMVIPLGRNNYIACVLIPTYALVSQYFNEKKLFKIIYSILIFIAVLATGSRLALLLYSIYLLYVIFIDKNLSRHLTKKRLFSIIASLFLMLLLIIIGTSFYSDNISAILSRFSASSLYENRFKVYADSIKLFCEYPLFGRSAFYYTAYDASKSHNFILESLVQTGIVGTIIYAFILYYAFIYINKIENKRIKSSIKSFMVLWLIQGLMEPNLFGLSSDFYFWLIVGIGVSFSINSQLFNSKELKYD